MVKNQDGLRGTLWTADDEANCHTAIAHSRNLCEAKMIQSYLAIKKFLHGLDVDIRNLPFVFSLTPNTDVRTLGPENPFLRVMLELHSPEQYLLMRKLLRWNYPRFIEASCPSCGESSKKIINGQIKGQYKRSVRLICSDKEKTFRNELGIDSIKRKGCDNRWDLELPSTAKELHDILTNGFSLYFPVNSLTWVINGISFAPAALLFTDAGFYMKDRSIQRIVDLPIGDHAELLIKMVALQRAFLAGAICPETFDHLKKQGLLVNSEPLLLGHQSPTQLFDPVLYTTNCDNRRFHITDSSIFAAIGHGLSSEDIVKRSLNITNFPTDKVMALIGR